MYEFMILEEKSTFVKMCEFVNLTICDPSPICDTRIYRESKEILSNCQQLSNFYKCKISF
jgi:hypothetical protein